MGILSWTVVGLIAGLVTKLLVPSRHAGVAVIIGIVGAFVGGFIARALGLGGVDGFNIGSFTVAAIGAIICLCLFALSHRDGVKGLGDGLAEQAHSRFSRSRITFKWNKPTECIFISYRREDTAGFARALFNELASRFKRSRVFMDVDTIEPGRDFLEAIEKAMSTCRVLLVLIGRNWSIERLSQPGDYIRAEIAEGLKQPLVRVVPVLVDGAEMPNSDDLPAELVPLIRRNAVKLSHDRFQSDIDQIAKVVQTDLRS